jgi:hypothetical protein
MHPIAWPDLVDCTFNTMLVDLSPVVFLGHFDVDVEICRVDISFNEFSAKCSECGKAVPLRNFQIL